MLQALEACPRFIALRHIVNGFSRDRNLQAPVLVLGVAHIDQHLTVFGASIPLVALRESTTSRESRTIRS